MTGPAPATQRDHRRRRDLPALAPPLAAWLRAAADGPVPPPPVAVARRLADRLP
ncbi:hypothetical protein ABC795_11540 [Blastococcus sp. HT6-30]|uniref:hypothetical protein n=1 Tax=Blastococcus sp. HT6-30 TaxID=3144843 RepID=UPI00321AEDB9